MKTGCTTRKGLTNVGASNKSVIAHNYNKTIHKRPCSDSGMYHREKDQRVGKQDDTFYESTSHYDANFRKSLKLCKFKGNPKRHVKKGFIGFNTHDVIVVDGVVRKIKHKTPSVSPAAEHSVVETPVVADRLVVKHLDGHKTVRVKCNAEPATIVRKMKKQTLSQKMNDRHWSI